MGIRNGKNNHPATAEQKRFRELLREQGSILTGSNSSKIEIHHPIGESAQVKGVGNIGHWFLNTLSQQEHQWIGGDIERFKRAMSAARFTTLQFNRVNWDIKSASALELSKALFLMELSRLIVNGHAMEITVPGDVLAAIMGYHR